MRLLVDTAGVTFTVTMATVEKTDQNGKQKVTRDGLPQWVVQVMALDETGGEMLKITTAGVRPEVKIGQLVVPVELEALPWNTNGKHGTAFRAKELRPATAKAS